MSWFENGLREMKDADDKKRHAADKARWLRDAALEITNARNKELPVSSALRIAVSESPNQLHLIKQDIRLGSFRIVGDNVVFTPLEDLGIQEHTMETEEAFRQFLIATAFTVRV